MKLLMSGLIPQAGLYRTNRLLQRADGTYLLSAYDCGGEYRMEFEDFNDAFYQYMMASESFCNCNNDCAY